MKVCYVQKTKNKKKTKQKTMAIAKLCLIMSSAFNVSSLEDYKFYCFAWSRFFPVGSVLYSQQLATIVKIKEMVLPFLL